ncbi:MAG: M67 family metallopeptidase [Anaerolineae bacterium]|jgi:proteasome lid subunit RPN8/RPN11|nr:M67 family metallopeptidase [Anaerolineae bacterium]
MIERVWLTPTLAKEVADHARAAYPAECCGVLAGRGGDVLRVIPVENVSDTPESAFAMSPAGLASALVSLEREGLALVGFYHSHPKTPPIPSGRDIAGSHYPDAAQLIVSLEGGEAVVAAWRIGVGEVQRLDLFIQSARPDDSQVEPLMLTPFQRIMVVVSGVVAVLVVVVTALALLPPPPELPLN